MIRPSAAGQQKTLKHFEGGDVQVGHRFFVADVATDDLSLLRRGEMPALLSHGTHRR